jgi:hypothetical protein
LNRRKNCEFFDVHVSAAHQSVARADARMQVQITLTPVTILLLLCMLGGSTVISATERGGGGGA